MKTKLKTALFFAIGAWIVLLAVAACGSELGPSNATVEVTSGREPNASVSGTVTYRERIALTPGATLEIELRDFPHAEPPHL